MMDWKIKTGGFVMVHFADSRRLYGKVLYYPQQAGECWIIESESDIHYVQQFVEIRKAKED